MKKLLLILTMLAALLLVSCKEQPKLDTMCAADAKLCADGSAVGRDPANNCEWMSCPEGNREEGLGLTDPYVQYVGDSRDQCAATDWICIRGSSQFFDDSGCGCRADEPKKYVSNETEVCMRVKYACEENYVPFSDETGCGCEFTFGEAVGMPPAPGKLKAIECTPEQRNQPCTREYIPVCGWDNECEGECNFNYGNKCNACTEGKIDYYTEGECPSRDDEILR